MYRKNAWLKYNAKEQRDEIFAFAEDYKTFLDKSKTEREFISNTIKALEDKGFKLFDSSKKYKKGDRVYFVNRGKNLACFVIGSKKLTDGMRILGAHVDSPRLDVKQNPLYEKSGFAYLDTHYYGGIKKYQWVTIPLALHGVVFTKEGKKVEIAIGEDPTDPIFGCTDLLIHLSAELMQKPASTVIKGEQLDLSFGSIPAEGDEKEPVKAYMLQILKEKYGIEEEDFVSAELEIVPANKARDYGIDRSMIAAYGQDDKVCSYTSLRAILDLDIVPEFTACVCLADKEEVGSIGNTGAQSKFFEYAINELLSSLGYNDINALARTLTNSKMLSSDVSAGEDPLYPGVTEEKNSCYLGRGIVFNKYTGARGKSGCNDASAEFVSEIRTMMEQNNINYQTAELGAVDVGGGGTIAYILSNLNIDVIDAGVPVLNMHSTMEISSKVDVFEAYNAYKVFLKN